MGIRSMNGVTDAVWVRGESGGMMQSLERSGFSVQFDDSGNVVVFTGAFVSDDRDEARTLYDFLRPLTQRNLLLSWDLQGLNQCSSTGLGALYHLVARLPEREGGSLVVRGAASVPWQVRCLPNLSHMHAQVQLDLR